MITLIHITEKQSGKILDYIPLGDFWDDNHHKSLKDTLEYFEFRTFGDKRYSQYLEKMNRIIIPDEDGTYIEFVIFHAIKYRLHNTVVIDVYAPASYLLLKKAKVIKPQRISEYTASQHLGFALNGTEWRPGIVESDKYRTLDIENHTNPYAYIKRIANEFELEPRFRIETDGNKVIGRYVDLLERVGEWQGREVEFGRDLLGIERKVDDSNVVTALIGLGPERDDGTRLEVFVEDEEALQRWGVPNPQTGELMHLIETYEPESTDQNMSIERLTELTRNELEKRISSVVEYTADVADLEKVPGMENKIIRFGDTIKIKDTGFNPPLYLEARVHTQDRSLSQPEKKKVTLGDFIEYTEEEVHAIWKQLQAEIAKKVSLAEVTEVVYTKPEVDERDDAVREHADNVAENAKIEAIQVAAEDASKKAKQAEDSAKEYTDGRLQNTVAKDIFENTVTDLLNNIAQKVDSTRFEQVESELRGIAEGLQREIEEHADTLEKHGGKITKLETDVDEVEGKISTTIAELQSLEETVSRHETQIEANAREIALKADKQELDLLSGTVSGISSELSVMAGKIEAKAERSEVEKLESDVSKVSQDVSKLTVDVDGIKTNVSSISQTVSNHGTQISNINSTLTQHADMIASKVEKSEFDSVTNTLGNRISTIEQTADSISLEVSDIKANVYTKSEVDSAIDEIQVGGRNLILNSVFAHEPYRYGDRAKFLLREYNKLVFQNEANSNSGPMFLFSRILEPGEYVLHFDLETDVALPFNYIYLRANMTDDESKRGTPAHKLPEQSLVVGQNKIVIHFSVNRNDIDGIWLGTNNSTVATFSLSNLKLEKGNKATDWTPAPEDIDEKFTDIEGTLASHNTKIEQNAQQIQLRATKAEVDTLSGRVNQAESQITQLSDQIALKANKSDVYTKTQIDGQFNLVNSQITDLSAQLSVQADQIATKVSRTEFESLQIGGRNLLIGSDTSKTFEWNSTEFNQEMRKSSNIRFYPDFKEMRGKEITISADIKAENLVKGNNRFWAGFEFSITYADGTRSFFNFVSKVPEGTYNWTRVYATNRVADKEISSISGLTILLRDAIGKFFMKNLKVEFGNKATDWTPAPEDVQGQIDGLGSRLSTAETSITQLSDQIILKANQSEVDALSGRVNQAESQITQLAGQIELRATKTEVDELTGRVSTVESTIQQHADMIESKIDAGDARSIFRQEASSFTFEANQINFKGHVFGEDATFVGELSTGIINTNEVYIGKKTLPFWEHFSSRIVMKNVIRITDGEFMEGEPFVIEVGNSDAVISTPRSLYLKANTVTIPGDIRLSDEGFVYTSAIDNHDAHASPHIYIRPRDANSEVRATVTGTTTEYVKVRAREFVAGGINGDGIFSADNSIAVLRAGPDRYAFVQSDLEVRATRRMQGSSYVPVRASSFPTGSLEEFKTNIKKWEESALDIIRNADIYEFNLKNDLEVGKNKKRYGLVIGDGYRTPEQVIDDDGVEQYAMNSISWKAIQELDTEQQELKGRIAWLEAENKLLREKIKKLEGMIS